jgi:predicted RNase H-like HicB family nuclease
MRYKVILQPSEEGFAVSVPGLPGCYSQGVDEQDALNNIRDALREYLEVVDDISRELIVREIEIGT